MRYGEPSEEKKLIIVIDEYGYREIKINKEKVRINEQIYRR